jgi:hypothetical protein
LSKKSSDFKTLFFAATAYTAILLLEHNYAKRYKLSI